MAYLKLTGDLAAGIVRVWPDLWPAAQVFAAMTTQWQYAGMDGIPMGLKYEALPAVQHLAGPRSEWPQVFADVRAMEARALNIMAARREAQAAERRSRRSKA